MSLVGNEPRKEMAMKVCGLMELLATSEAEAETEVVLANQPYYRWSTRSEA